MALAPTLTPLPAFQCGDANQDGGIDAVDAALILQEVVGFDVSIDPDTSDIDASGDLTAVDAALVLQHHAGLIGEGDLTC
jgi:hypothetical protein